MFKKRFTLCPFIWNIASKRIDFKNYTFTKGAPHWPDQLGRAFGKSCSFTKIIFNKKFIYFALFFSLNKDDINFKNNVKNSSTLNNCNNL